MSKCTCMEKDGHEQDCPNKPLRPGDYVRWDNHAWDRYLWIVGRLVSFEQNPDCPTNMLARIEVTRSVGFTVGTTQTVGVERGATLRRYEELSDGSYKAHTAWSPSVPLGLTASGGIEISGSVPGMKIGKECAVSPAGIRLRGDSDHRVDAMRYAMSSLGTYDEMFAKIQSDIADRQFKVSLDASWMDRAFHGVPGPAKEREMCCIPGATAATGRCGHGHLYRSKVRDTTPTPGPVLHDGLTAEQCLELYVERQREHDGSADCYMMTKPQLAAARELWSAQLRARRDATKEKERCAVTYCEVDSDD